jgi:hypothetical protein
MTITTTAATGLRDPLGRLHVVETCHLPGAVKYVAEFSYRDVRGMLLTGRGKFYVPTGAAGPHPLMYCAGYEVAPDELALAEVAQGWLLVTPVSPDPESVWPGDNPLGRSLNLDVALLHAARSLAVVDDAKVLIAGGSAGGWLALMLAAETFPLAAVVAQVPPVNWGYNAAYGLHNRSAGIPALVDASALAQWGVDLLGPDTSSSTWWVHSPLAHVDRITCPVHLSYSTADVLVPIDQVSAALVRTPEPGAVPAGYRTDPDVVAAGYATTRLCDVVPDAEVTVLQLPVGALPAADAAAAAEPARVVLPAGSRQWSIVVLDEGAPSAEHGHTKYAVAFDRSPFVDRIRQWNDDPAQATVAKLEVLARRYAGEDWVDSPVPHLDVVEAERFDVERALATFRRMPGGNQALAALPDELLRRLP